MQFNSKMLQAYLVGGTQDTHHDPNEFLQRVELAMQSGITAFQYREKGDSHLSRQERLEMAQRLRKLTYHYQIPYFIDDDEKLALQVGADGVHVGQKDQKIETVIRRAAGQLMIGYSCNTPSEIEKANHLMAVDYVGSGPVFPTNSKADADPVLGLTKLHQLVQASHHPIVAIGGLNPDNIKATAKTGVAGGAVISMIMQSNNIPETVAQLLHAFH